MPIDVQPPQIRSRESPREILTADFKSSGELPIKGGWGYSIDDAVIIDKNDPIVPRDIPFDGVGLEYIFVKQRIHEELIIFQPKDNQFSGIRWNFLGQVLKHTNDKSYDVLTFEVTAIPDKAWDELKAEWEGPNGYGSPAFDINAHMIKKDSQTIRYVTEYYFDITSFFNSY